MKPEAQTLKSIKLLVCIMCISLTKQIDKFEIYFGHVAAFFNESGYHKIYIWDLLPNIPLNGEFHVFSSSDYETIKKKVPAKDNGI